ncbi:MULTISPECIES: P-II family nitrogen regulator [Methanothrix]|jgi:nitrogen regulatory protein PII 2|uniref:Nitrogen fixation nifHD region glnB-like protein 2 (Nitrogen regulatory protein P-II) n=4 Tax=root TaxID=1 RepID=F4BXC5_METSG|nr:MULTISPECIES: P-II family nitrogen regulator [Methanothrix]AEB67438.1 Nitrogen fixation nifHD region glnB-like protein 2 (nitrogen regulatory protein P-II) [Methanothrix soehngenii GP6]MDY0413202.1 P-II family nitrogen regulator [Methanothrix soehngenii]NLJ22385.1 P-II family nitrogen regulator [Methanothrix soehngenii]UEC39594.1 MAG: Nitrogen fixation nifHD region GlnB-like protein 2 [Methanothrix sp.]HNQ52923.1 P-II family nitrogen regulator [Methanothrix soehngenii]
MKEVIAIIQLNKMEATKDALEVIGISSFTAYKASGRGKQKGLQIPHPTPLDERDERDERDEKRMKYIPKRMISVMVEDEFVPAVVAVITKVNRTGNYGDGRIFVSPMEESVRIRTGERGSVAIS